MGRDKTLLQAKLIIYKDDIRFLLKRLDDIEQDTQTTNENKLVEVKKIREEMSKISKEIDKIRQDITLLDAHKVN